MCVTFTWDLLIGIYSSWYIIDSQFQLVIDWLPIHGYQYWDAVTQISQCVFREYQIMKSYKHWNFMFGFAKTVLELETLAFTMAKILDEFRLDA